jgi:hypothetical protein
MLLCLHDAYLSGKTDIKSINPTIRVGDANTYVFVHSWDLAENMVPHMPGPIHSHSHPFSLPHPPPLIQCPSILLTSGYKSLRHLLHNPILSKPQQQIKSLHAY